MAVQLLQAGEAVAVPTETVYGLAANALSSKAVARIFAAKQRPSDNLLIVHVSSLEMLQALYPPDWKLPASYLAAIAAFWPGPLTILLPRSELVPEVVTCGQPTMAVRLPSHPVARALIEACGFSLAAPSANSSGRPSPTNATHVMEDLSGRIPLVLDGGPCGCGVESTVLDALRSPPVILRPGGVTYEQLSGLDGLQGLQVYRRDFVDAALEAKPSTPGMKYRHYSPNAPVVLLDPRPQSTSSTSSAKGASPEPSIFVNLHGGLQSAGNRPEVLHVAAGVVNHLEGPDAADVLTCSCTARQVACMQAATDSALAQLQQQGLRRVGVLLTSLQLAKGEIASVGLQQEPPHGMSQGVCPAGQVAGSDGMDDAHFKAVQYVLAVSGEPEVVARELFRGLRCLDEMNVQAIIVQGVDEAREGLAVMNRLRKAASTIVPV